MVHKLVYVAEWRALFKMLGARAGMAGGLGIYFPGGAGLARLPVLRMWPGMCCLNRAVLMPICHLGARVNCLRNVPVKRGKSNRPRGCPEIPGRIPCFLVGGHWRFFGILACLLKGV